MFLVYFDILFCLLHINICEDNDERIRMLENRIKDLEIR
jgi:hypothetical protein